MMRSKRVVAVLGLCAALLALVVFGTSASQAEKGANWMVNGTNVTTTLLPVVQITNVVNKMMALVGATKSGTKVEVACTNAEFLNAKLEAEGTVSSGNVTKFTGCVTKLNGVITASCSPKTKGEEKGVVASEPLKGLIVLHEGKPLVKFTPVTGTTFVNFIFGEECSLGEEVPVTGSSTVQESKGEFSTELVEHSVEQGPLSSLTFCGTPAVVVGSAFLGLSGVHKGIKWSALPA
jgi:hypothetical protein